MLQGQYKILKLFELIFSVFSLFHLAQALTPLLLSGGVSEGDNVDVNSIDYSLNAKISLLIFLISIVLLVLRWKKVLVTIHKNPLIWLLVLILCMSYFWSILPDQTLRFSIYATGTTLFGLYLGTRYTLREQINIFSFTFALMVILSLVFALAIPSYGLMAGVHEGALRGIFTHKNQLGLTTVPAAVLFFLQALRSRKYSWLFWLLLVVCVCTIILSRSASSYGNLGLMLILCLIYRVLRWRYDVMISAVLIMLLAGITAILLFIGYLESDVLFVAIGKDSTFSGRTLIWDSVWDQIQLRPWLGYGLAAFWNGIKGPSGIVELTIGAKVAYAHNGFLDIWLSSGIIGLSVFILSLFNNIIKSLVFLRYSKGPGGFWPLLFFSYILLSNIAEGGITTMSNAFWAIYVATSYSLTFIPPQNEPVI